MTTPKALAATLKSGQAKLTKNAPPYLKSDWDKYLKAVDSCVKALEGGVEPASLATDRTNYAKKLEEAKALKTSINGAVDKVEEKLKAARSAKDELVRLGNDLGKIVKDKLKEPGAKAIAEGLNFSPIAEKGFSSLEVPKKVD